MRGLTGGWKGLTAKSPFRREALTVSRFWREPIGRSAGTLFLHDPIHRGRSCLLRNYVA